MGTIIYIGRRLHGWFIAALYLSAYRLAERTDMTLSEAMEQQSEAFATGFAEFLIQNNIGTAFMLSIPVVMGLVALFYVNKHVDDAVWAWRNTNAIQKLGVGISFGIAIAVQFGFVELPEPLGDALRPQGGAINTS